MKNAFIILFVFILSLGFNACKENKKEKEALRLEKKRQTLSDLSNSVICKDSTKWTFTPIGNKACGGPTEYMAYSTQIDTVDFLDKVNTYTKAMREYNEKWGIFSTCDIPPPPIGVSCTDNKAVLVY